MRSTRTLLAAASAVTLATAFDPTHLFPVKVSSAWTTLPTAPSGSGATVVALDDGVLGVRKKMSGVNYTVTDAPGSAPSGAQAWPAFYPAGSWNPDGSPRGGLGFYFPGPEGSWWNDSSVTQILFSYAVMFPADFEPVQGGKLPGPYGGTDDNEAYACSGGRQQDRADCFDLRLMWRTDLAGEIYAYLPETTTNTNSVGELQGSVIDNTYGFSVARGSFTFAKGDYTVVAQRVQLNTEGNSDGELELWVNGNSTIHATGLQIATNSSSIFRGVHFQTFFGGSDNTWATPVDQTVYFTGMSGGIVANGTSSAQGKAAYPLGQSTTTVHGSGSSTADNAKSTSGGAGQLSAPVLFAVLVSAFWILSA